MDKEKCLTTKLAEKEDTLFQGSKCNARQSGFKMEGPITEKARCCLSAEWAGGTKSSPLANNKGLSGKLSLKLVYRELLGLHVFLFFRELLFVFYLNCLLICEFDFTCFFVN